MFSDPNESQHSELMNLNTSNKHVETNIDIADAQTPLIDEDEDNLVRENAGGGHVIKNKLGTINGCYGMCLLCIIVVLVKPLFFFLPFVCISCCSQQNCHLTKQMTRYDTFI